MPTHEDPPNGVYTDLAAAVIRADRADAKVRTALDKADHALTRGWIMADCDWCDWTAPPRPPDAPPGDFRQFAHVLTTHPEVLDDDDDRE